ncbi:DMT family transporter [Nocardioides ultimimeridianus]
MIWPAVCLALASAATTGLSTAIQHHVAGQSPLGGVWRRPRWLLALALGPVGFTAHALALRHGPISLVQPVVVVGVVAALPLRDLVARTRPRWSDVRTATATVAALALLLLAAAPRPARTAPDPTALFLATAAGVGLAGLAAVLSRAVRRPATRAAALGLASGVLFALMAVLVDATQLWLRSHPLAALPLVWLPYAVVGCGVGGLAVNQVAYGAGPLAASMPVLNVTNCLLTVALGVTVLHESVQTSPWRIAVALACAAVIGRVLVRMAGAPADSPAPAPVAVA